MNRVADQFADPLAAAGVQRIYGVVGDTGQDIVDIALRVGFQSQAHFTAVFKRFVADNPSRWRRHNAYAI